MKTRLASAISRCRTFLRRWLRWTWLSRLPLEGPRPWQRTAWRPRRRAGEPQSVFRPNLEVLESRWTPDDLFGAATSPVAVGSLVLLTGSRTTPLRLLFDNAPRPAAPTPALPPDTSADTGTPSRDPDAEEAFASGDIKDLAFLAALGQLPETEYGSAPARDGAADEPSLFTSLSDPDDTADPLNESASAHQGQPPSPLSNAPPAAPESPAKYAGGGAGGGGSSTPNAGRGGGGPTGGGSLNLHLPSQTQLQQTNTANNVAAAAAPTVSMPLVPVNENTAPSPAPTSTAASGMSPTPAVSFAPAAIKASNLSASTTGTTPSAATGNTTTPSDNTAGTTQAPTVPTASAPAGSGTAQAAFTPSDPQAASTMTLTSSANPSPVKQTVTLTATVTGSSGTPTGTVTFLDGTDNLGTKTLDSNGQATLALSAQTVSSQNITAIYSGDATYTPNAASLTQTFTLAASTIGLSSSANPSLLNNSVTFTALVSGSSGMPTGSVAFYDDTTALATAAVNGSGVATYTTSDLSAGSHDITAIYSGDSSYVGDTDSLTQAVNSAFSGTGSWTLSDSINYTTNGTIGGTVSGNTISSSGDIFGGSGGFNGTISDNTISGNFSGNFNLSGVSGTYSGTIGGTISGNTISLDFNGSYNSTSGPGNLTGDFTSTFSNPPASSSIALSSSPNASTPNQSVTLTATVTGSSGTPTGSVIFYNGTTVLGTETLNASAVATYPLSPLAVDSYDITAIYGGNSTYGDSTASLTQVVDLAGSAVALSSSANPAVYGQSITLTATVTGSGGTPTGTVTFYDGTTLLGTASIVNGVATYTTSPLNLDSYDLVAIYLGDVTFSGSSSAMLIQTVNQANTSTSLTATPNPSNSGQPVTFTATVSVVSPGSGTVSGLVEFEDGITVLDTAVLNSSGVATFTTAGLGGDAHDITAVYEGDVDFLGSQASLTQNVNQAATSTSLYAFPNPSVYGQKVTFVATVADTATPAAGPPTGQVVFENGNTTLGHSALSNGAATFSTSGLPVGIDAITASYQGNSDFLVSQGSINQTVAKASSATTLISSRNPSSYGYQVTFTATVQAVSPASGTPTGKVVFEDGSTTLGNANLNGVGVATLGTSALIVSDHDITAIYQGDTNFVGSQVSLTQTVTGAASSTQLTSTADPSVYGQKVTFTATVQAVAPATGTPTGTVAFLDGSMPLGQVALSNGQATFSTSALVVGDHDVIAEYEGADNFLASEASTTQTVNQASTSTTLTSSPNPSTLGQMVTLTATVTALSPSSAAPTGVVLFEDGSTTLGIVPLTGNSTTGPATAVLQTPFLTVGTNELTALYEGNPNFKSSQVDPSQIVTNSPSPPPSPPSPPPVSWSVQVTYTNATISPFSTTEGQVYTGTVIKGLYDPDPTTQYSEVVDWGDGTKTNTIAIGSAASPLPTLSHVYTLAGSYLVIDNLITKRGTSPQTVTGTTAVSGNALVLPVSLHADSLSLPYGEALNNATVSTFSVTGGKPSDFVASIDWGDGTGPQLESVVAENNGVFAVVGSHVYQHPGDFLTDVQVTNYNDNQDHGGYEANGDWYFNYNGPVRESIGTIEVNSSATAPDLNMCALDVQADQQDEGQIEVATFSIGDTALASAAIAATIDWGDGTQTTYGIIDGSGGNFKVYGSHIYVQPGQYLLTVNITTPSDTALGWATAHIGTPAVVPSNQSLILPPYTYYSPILLTTFANPNPSLIAADFRATVNWNNGSTGWATVSGSAGTFFVSATPPGINPGQFLAEVVIQNTAGEVLATDIIPVTGTDIVDGVANAPHSFGWFHVVSPDPIPNPPPDFQGSIDWGDGSELEHSYYPPTPYDGTQIYYEEANYYHYYENNDPAGLYTQHINFLLVSDNTITLASSVQQIYVGDDPLINNTYELSHLEPTANVALTAVSVAQFTDDDPDGAVGNFNAMIDWGDGSTSTGTVILLRAGNPDTGQLPTFAVQGNHVYAADGNYTVTTLIQDTGGAAEIVSSLPADSPLPPPPPPPPPTVSLSALVRSDDPTRALLLPVGEATVDLNQSAVRVSQPLDFDASPGTTIGGNPALVYNSATADGQPILQLALTSSTAPQSATFTVSWEGTTLTPIAWTPPSNQNGPIYVIDLPITSTITASGVYNWTVKANVDYVGGSTSTGTISGQSSVVVNTASPYGAGWGLQSTSRLVSDLNGDMLMIQGNGDARLFTFNPHYDTFTSPAEDFGTLSGGLSLGYYLYTDTHDVQYSYDLNGRLTQIAQPNGWTTTYSYRGGLLSSVTTPDVGSTSLTYSGGLLSSIDEPGGRVVILDNDASGNLTDIIDAAGSTRSLSYDGQHLLTTDNWNPYDSTYGYSTLGLLDSLSQGPVNYSITSANSALLVNHSDQPLATMTNGVGDTTTYLLDSRGRELEETQPDGSTATWQLDYTGNADEYTDFDGLTTYYDYQDSYSYIYVNGIFVYQPATGNLLQVTYPNRTNQYYAYNATFNEVTKTIDPAGDVTLSQYDAEGELTSQTTGAGSPQTATTSYTWLGGLMQTMSDPDGNSTSYTYAGTSFLLANQVVYNSLNHEVSSQSYTYDANGNPATSVDSDNGTTQYHYDGDNNLIETIDPDGITTSQQYDAAGMLTASVDGRGVSTVYSYDGAGLQTSQTTAANTSQAETAQSAYNAAGEQTLTVDADGISTSYAYDSDGYATLVLQAFDTPQQAATSYDYDHDGNPTLSVDADGHSSSYAYDAAGEQTLTVDADGNSTSYAYDGDGNLILQIIGANTPDAEATSYAYDANGNLILQVTGFGTAQAASTFSLYDGDGNLTEQIDPNNNTSTFLYDALGDQTESITGTATTSSFYDSDGNLTLTIDADGNSTSYQYDADGNETLMIQGLNTLQASTMSMAYDADGNQTLVVQGAGTSAAEATFDAYDLNGNQTEVITGYGSTKPETTTMLYDADNILTQQVDGDQNTSSFLYDALGDQTESIVGNATTSSSYDGDGNLTLSVDADGHSTSYLYDAAGNETLMIQGVGTTNALSSTSYGYDAAGNQTLVVIGLNGSDPESTSYSYDANGNQIQVITGLNSTQQDTTVSAYDGDGNLIEQIDPNNNTSAYFYDALGDQTLALQSVGTSQQSASSDFYDSDGNLTLAIDAVGHSTSYQYDAVGNETLMIQGVGTSVVSSTSYGYDAAGNETLVVIGDGTSAAESTSYAYDANGNQIEVITGYGSSPIGGAGGLGGAQDGGEGGAGGANGTDGFTLGGGGGGGGADMGGGNGASGELKITLDDGTSVMYTTPGTYTWTAPDTETVMVQAWGGGGGGSGGTGSSGGYGGGGGGYGTVPVPVIEGDVYTVVVGYGGSGGSAGANGFAGVRSAFSLNGTTYIYGGGGGAGTLSGGGIGNWYGGSGATGYYGGHGEGPEFVNYQVGGGGGGGAGSGGAGGNGGYGSPNQETTSMSYDADNNLTQQVDGDNNTSTFLYDALGDQIKSVVGTATTSSFYDGDGNRTLAVDANHNTTSYQYDADGNETLMLQGVGTGALSSTSYGYDASGNQILVVIGLNGSDPESTSYRYDANGNQTQVITGFGSSQQDTTVSAYDGDGNLTQQVDPNNNTSSFLYDALGDPTQSVVGNATTKDSYDGDGNLTLAVDAAGHTTSYQYDADGHETLMLQGVGTSALSSTSYGYDAAGNQTLVVTGVGTSAAESTFYAYDANGNPIGVITGYGSSPVGGAGGLGGAVDGGMGGAGGNSGGNGANGSSVGGGGGGGSATGSGGKGADGQVEITWSGGNSAVYPSHGTYTWNSPITGSVTVQAWGGGGGGGGGTGSSGGYGGGGGGYGTVTVSVTEYAAYTVVVGTGGWGGSEGANGSAGTRSSFSLDSTTYLYGGGGGAGTLTGGGIGNWYGGANATGYYGGAGQGPQSSSYAVGGGGGGGAGSGGGGGVGGYGSPKQESTTARYDGDNNLTLQVDADGHDSAFAYDALGDPTKSILGNGTATSSSSYDGAGNLTLSVDADGNSTSYQYDADGNETLMIQGVGTGAVSSTSYGYDASGNQTMVVTGLNSSNPESTSYAYDANGNQTLQISGYGSSHPETTTFQYDGDGNLTQQVDGDHNTSTFAYDALGNQTQSVVGGGTTSNFYAGDGNLILTVNPVGDSTSYQYDGDGNQTLEIDGYGSSSAAVIHYLYDASGNPTQEIDADNNTTSFQYDADGEQTLMIQAYGTTSAASTSYQYDNDGNLMLQTNANGTSIASSYDLDGNLTHQLWYAGGSITNNISYTYDKDGNILTASNDAGSYTFAYNADGEQTQVVTPSGVTLNYLYDADGNVTQLTDSTGDTVTSQYDANGNLLQRNATGPGGVQADVSLAYDGDGNIVLMTRQGQVAGVLQTVGRSNYSYDAQGDISSIVHQNGSGSTLDSFGYSYNVAGQVTREVDHDGTTTDYSYDAAGQLISAGTSSYSYDANGNPNNNSGYTVGANNELTSDGTWNYAYDANGNQTEKVGVSGGADAGLTWTYTYDAENELLSATETNAQSQTLVQASFTYDVFGNISQSSISTGGSPVVTNYVYNDNTLLLTLTSDTPQTLYVGGDQPDQFFFQIDASNGTAFDLNDKQNSVRDLMNNSGQVTDAITYDAYGNIVSQSQPSQAPAVGWDGYQTFAALGLDVAGIRDYNPQSQQWLQQDSILTTAGPNTREYADNNPTNETDPSGMAAAPLNKPQGLMIDDNTWTADLSAEDQQGISSWWQNLSRPRQQAINRLLNDRNEVGNPPHPTLQRELLRSKWQSSQLQGFVTAVGQPGVLPQGRLPSAATLQQWNQEAQQAIAASQAKVAAAQADVAAWRKSYADYQAILEEHNQLMSARVARNQGAWALISPRWWKPEEPSDRERVLKNQIAAYDDDRFEIGANGELIGVTEQAQEIAALLKNSERVQKLDAVTKLQEAINYAIDSGELQGGLKEAAKELTSGKSLSLMLGSMGVLAGISTAFPPAAPVIGGVAAGVGYLMFGSAVVDVSKDMYLFVRRGLAAVTPQDIQASGRHFAAGVKEMAQQTGYAAEGAVIAKAGVVVGGAVLKKRLKNVKNASSDASDVSEFATLESREHDLLRGGGSTDLGDKILGGKRGTWSEASKPGQQYAGKTPHHVIPEDLRNHRVIKEIGYQMQSEFNGIILDKTYHTSRHPGVTDAIEAALNAIKLPANPTQADRLAAAREVEKIVNASKTLLDQQLPLHKKILSQTLGRTATQEDVTKLWIERLKALGVKFN